MGPSVKHGEVARRLLEDAVASIPILNLEWRAQVWTLRERLLKLGASVVVSVRRVVIHLPVSFPFLSSFRQIALSFGAASG
jgi:hypothetical protein